MTVKFGLNMFAMSVISARSSLDSVSGPQLLLNLAGRGFRCISGLDEFVDSNQGLFQCPKRAGVQHFLLDFGRVRAPGHQEQLLLLGALCCPLTLVLVLEVVQTVAALSLPGRLEVSQELLVAGVSPAELLHCDELLVLDEEDAVAVGLVLLDLLEDIFAVVSNSNSRGHYQSLQAVSCRSESSNISL